MTFLRKKLILMIWGMSTLTLTSCHLFSSQEGENSEVHADHSATKVPENKQIDLSNSNEGETYFCPMHPEIRQGEPGKCPICGMDLVKANPNQMADGDAVKISKAHRRLAGIKTEMIEYKTVSKTISAIGFVEVDETTLSVISAHVDGRIERQFADFTGVEVKKGDHLAVLYSPELNSAQEEFVQLRKTYLNAKRKGYSNLIATQRRLVKNAEYKLSEMGMSQDQIDELKKAGKAKSRVEIRSPISGTIIEKNITLGQYFKSGQLLYKIANLNSVWLMAEIFPEDAPFIHYGQKVTATVRGAPGVAFTGRVAFVSPVIDSTTRTVRARIEVQNINDILRPGDYADVSIEVDLSYSSDGKKYDPELAGKYISPMHPRIIRDEPGKCPICGMDLVPAKDLGFMDEEPDAKEFLVVPRDAVLKIGSSSVVFVEAEDALFKIREVKTGITVGDEIVITEGLEEFEDVATEGVYLIDSQMQLSGNTSLLDINKKKSVEKKK